MTVLDVNKQNEDGTPGGGGILVNSVYFDDGALHFPNSYVRHDVKEGVLVVIPLDSEHVFDPVSSVSITTFNFDRVKFWSTNRVSDEQLNAIISENEPFDLEEGEYEEE